ncbi:hypothetical protein [Paenibacillus terrigena]|uniref:hypothetical protein n=1 Tax=Paenibacillus terrigena TaxID=369333 RepID=UPI0028D8610C|nr:hypothetical protein [Paenibacillus terrigena]
MKRAILLIILVLFISAGCSINSKFSDNKSYIYTVEIENNNYGFTGIQIPKEKIGNKIGVETISCSVSECKAPPGDVFYEIKGAKSKETVAVLSSDGKVYYQWERIN